MKKFFSAILLMTMMVFSVGTFVSCNDLVNEIEGVKGQTGELQTAIAELEGEIASLETALQNAKAEAAAAAKTAADAAAKAQETGDKALKAAQDAAAAAAAAQASADAIEETLAAAKTALQAAIDGKADKADVEAAVKDIKALQAALEGKADKTDVDALKAELDLLKKTLEGYKDLLAQLEILTPTLDERINYNLEAVTNAQGTADANAEEIAALKDQINDLNANLIGFTTVINDLVNRIQSVVYVPEYTDGIIRANKYYSGDFDSDYYVKATFEVTPKELAAEITDANVYFNTVDTKAAAAEVVVAKVLSTSAATGRVEVLGYVKDNDANKVAYAELDKYSVENTAVWKEVEKTDSQGNKYWTLEYVGFTEKEKSEVAFALNIVNDNASVTLPDSTEVDADVHVSSAYVPVIGVKNSLNSVARTYNTEKNEWVNRITYDSNGDLYPTEEISVKYTDLETKSPLAKYDLRFDILDTPMTVAEAAAFLGTTIKVEMPDELVEYNVYHKNNAVTLDQENKKNPFSVKLNDFLSTVALVTPSDPANASLKDYRTSNVTIELPLIDIKNYNWTRKVKVNGYYAHNAYPVAAKVTIDYATSNADIDFGTFDAGSWSYKYWNGNEHRYTNWAINKEIRLNVPMDLAKLKVYGYVAYDNNGYFSVPVHADSDADGVADKTGYAYFEVLSSNTVELYGLDIPITDKPLTYSTDEEFYYVDSDNIKYTAKFSATVGARPADKPITLPAMEIPALTKKEMTKKVAVLEAIVNADAAYYTDLTADNGLYTKTHTMTYTPVGVPYFRNITFTNLGTDDAPQYVENTEVVVPAFGGLSKDFELEQVVTFYGVEYTLVADVKVVEPTYSIAYEASLIKNGVAEVVGKVGFPNWINSNNDFVSEKFTLNEIDLYDYIYVNDDVATAIINGEAAIVYQMQQTEVDANGDPCVPAGITPAKSVTTTETENILTWGNTDINEVKLVIALVSTLLDEDDAPVKVYTALPVTLWIDDYVDMTLKSTPTSAKFVTGENALNQLNVVNSIEIKGTHADFYTGTRNKWGYLYNPAAANVDELFVPSKYKSNPAQMTTDNSYTVDLSKPEKLGFAVYGQEVEVETDPKKCEAKLASGANFTGKWTVDEDGYVTLIDHDSPLVEDVIITVPVTLTHWYGDKQVVNAQVKFLAK